MSNPIGWTDQTWNPVTGCTPVSPACDHCYAKRMSKRLAGRFGYPADDPFAVTLHEDKLADPIYWRKGKRIFTVSMGDLFHEDVPDAWLLRVWNTMRACSVGRGHVFQILTKRPERMRDFCQRVRWDSTGQGRLWLADTADGPGYCLMPQRGTTGLWNVWLGVTAENQYWADERIPILLDTPAAVRFVSVEPMLGPVDLTDITIPISSTGADHISALFCDVGPEDDQRFGGATLDWVICGGETDPGARLMQPEWARDLRDQCLSAGVPFHMKQMTAKAPIPDDLMVREFPV